ncbi:hypothetical protein [Bacillus salipaludis]|nr:hypothetical protein [Bacillus salipaludis]
MRRRLDQPHQLLADQTVKSFFDFIGWAEASVWGRTLALDNKNRPFL